MPWASSAVTVTSRAVPAIVCVGSCPVAPVNEKCVAVPAPTLIDEETPVIDEVTVSVAVTVWVPAVSRVTEKVPAPFIKVVSADSLAAPSVLVKCTVPG